MSDFETSFKPIPLPMGPNDAKIQNLLGAGPAGVEKPDDMAQAAKDFESVLIHQLMDTMAKTIPDSGLTSNGVSKQVQGMFWSFLADEVADNGGMGMWKDIQKYCMPQEPNNPPAPTVEQKL